MGWVSILPLNTVWQL